MAKIFFCFLVVINTYLYAQDFKMGYTTPSTSPAYNNVSLQVEGVDATTGNPVAKGVLVAAMTTAQRGTISATNSPDGLLVFDTDVKGFFYLSGGVWVQIASQSTRNSALTDNSLTLVTGNTFINSAGGTLSLRKENQPFILIPQGAGDGTNPGRSTGIAITDGSDSTVSSASLVNFNGKNKGLLLPRVDNLSSIPNPPFGLIVILQKNLGSPRPQTDDGIYVNLGYPNGINWVKIVGAP